MKKVLLITIILIIFCGLIIIFVGAQLVEPIVPNPVAEIAQTPPKKDCGDLTKKFIEEHGYEKSGLNFYSYTKENTQLGCLLNVELNTKWKEGMKGQDFYLNLFNLTTNTVISSYKGRGDGHSPFKEEPKTLECVIYGTQEFKCKSFKEYITFIDRILSQ